MAGMMPIPTTPAASNELFNRTGAVFRDAFAEARSLGVRTCVGTETPLTIPTQVKERLRKMGRNPGDPAVVRELYEGIFRRIAAACPVDYYWLWTPESWTWESDKPGEFKATAADIQAALAGLKAAGNPFTLAMCGWVLGPRQDRAALDRLLPKECPISCINRKVGHAPDEPGFANITDRPKWVIPWLENDPSLVAPEPWAGRMRFDAVEGLRLGCTGLIGIHWRTKAIAANIAALAAAGWDQSWVPPGFDTSRIPAGAPAADPGSDTEGLDHPRKGRSMPVGAFYEDYARANFGAGVAREAGAILAGIDGVNLPEPATWIKGPGDIKVNKEPWVKVAPKYAFVGRLAGLRAKVAGAGNLERFDALLNTYRAMEAMAEAGCARGELDRMADAIAAAKDPARARALAGEALAVRIGLARTWERMMRCQVGATDTPGDLGTLSNLEQHSRVFMNFLGADDAALEKALGRPLPKSAAPSREYAGPPRIVLPTVRTLASRDEELRLRVIVLDARPVARASLFFRAMGSGAYTEVPVTRVARAVYEATIPPLSGDTEYYIQARTAGGRTLRWPAAPGLTQTIVVR